MTKFESVGVSIQMDSYSAADAYQRFRRSCELCCYRNICLDCDACAIAQAHKLALAYFSDSKKEAS